MRAIVLMGLAWAVAWGLSGIVPANVPGFEADLPFGYQFAPIGLIGGLVFAILRKRVERRSGAGPVPAVRLAWLGGAAGLVLATLFIALRPDLRWAQWLVLGPLLAAASAGATAVALRFTRSSHAQTGPAN